MALARSGHGPDPRGLVPGRRLPDPLPRQVARLPRRSPDPRHPRGLMASDDDGRPIAEGVDAYRRADRLDPFGFSGWIGREPHGPRKADCGAVHDGVFADQVVELFAELAPLTRRRPMADGGVVRQPSRHRVHRHVLGQGPPVRAPDDSVPDIPEAPSQSDTFAGRPPCQEQFTRIWPQMTYEQPADVRLPTAVLPPAPARRPSDRPRPRRAPRFGNGRRHHRRVHIGPRRPAGRPRWLDAEVVQRVRRGDPRSAGRQGPGVAD